LLSSLLSVVMLASDPSAYVICNTVAADGNNGVQTTIIASLKAVVLNISTVTLLITVDKLIVVTAAVGDPVGVDVGAAVPSATVGAC
jgi:hypothetical protein